MRNQYDKSFLCVRCSHVSRCKIMSQLLKTSYNCCLVRCLILTSLIWWQPNFQVSPVFGKVFTTFLKRFECGEEFFFFPNLWNLYNTKNIYSNLFDAPFKLNSNKDFNWTIFKKFYYYFESIVPNIKISLYVHVISQSILENDLNVSWSIRFVWLNWDPSINLFESLSRVSFNGWTAASRVIGAKMTSCIMEKVASLVLIKSNVFSNMAF